MLIKLAPFLTALRRAYPAIEVTAFLRSSRQDEELRRLKIQIVHGSFGERQKLVDECSKHDLIVDMADSGDPSITETVLHGMKVHGDSKSTLVHLSGAGNFTDAGKTGDLVENGKFWSVSVKEILHSRLEVQLSRIWTRRTYDPLVPI